MTPQCSRRFAIGGAYVMTSLALAGPPCGDWQHTSTPAPGEGSIVYGATSFGPDDVWAIGKFDNPCGAFCADQYTLAMHWDGTSWTQMATPSPGVWVGGGTDAILYTVGGAAPDDVWALGTYLTTHEIDGFMGFQVLALHWDGAAWQQIDAPHTPIGGTGASINGMHVVSADDIWAVGSTSIALNGIELDPLVMRWDGSQWTDFAAPPPMSNDRHELNAVAVLAPDDVWAVGSWGEALGKNVYLVHYDGSSWTTIDDLSLPGGLNSLEDLTVIAPDDIWAVGRNAPGDGTSRPLILHYDGTSWTHQTNVDFANVSAELETVEAAAPDDIWAAGVYTTALPPATSRPLIMHFDGVTWSQVDEDPTGPSSGWFRDLVVTAECDAWVVGQQGIGLSHVQQLIADEPVGIPGDLDGDGVVKTTDLLIMLAAWGQCPAEGECAADLDDDGTVGTTDLLTLLANWS